MESDEAFCAVVSGRVQGVGFRESVRRYASDIGIRGWVRNLPDGTVDLHAEGTTQQLSQLVDFLKIGPHLSRVDDVNRRAENVEMMVGFEIRF